MKKTPFKFKPIRYDARQVGLMLRVAVFFKPSLFKEIGAESPEEVEICADLIAEGCTPSPAVLRFLSLQMERKGCFVWSPR